MITNIIIGVVVAVGILAGGVWLILRLGPDVGTTPLSDSEVSYTESGCLQCPECSASEYLDVTNHRSPMPRELYCLNCGYDDRLADGVVLERIGAQE